MNPLGTFSQEIPSISFSKACESMSTYETEGGVLYLTDGAKRTFRVIIEEDDPIIQGSIRGFFDVMAAANASQAKKTEDSQRLQGRPVMLTEIIMGCNYTKNWLTNFVNYYALAYGFQAWKVGNDKLYPFLQEIMRGESFDPLSSWCESAAAANGSRKLIAKALQTQEDSILTKIPQQTLKSPELLRPYLENLLSQKGISYDRALKQFDWVSGRPKEPVIEGS